MISISRPGKSWNFSEGHGKANMLLGNKRQKDNKIKKVTDKSNQALISVEIKTSMYCMHYNAGKYVKRLF